MIGLLFECKYLLNARMTKKQTNGLSDERIILTPHLPSYFLNMKANYQQTIARKVFDYIYSMCLFSSPRDGVSQVYRSIVK